MPKTLRIILTTLGTVIVAAWIVYTAVFLPDSKEEQICRRLQVIVCDSTERRFFTEQELLHRLSEAGVRPEGAAYRDISTQAIEDAAMQLHVLRDAQCYKLGDGTICLSVHQREPRLRVIGEENYYVDSDRRIMRATFQTACHVPVLTGRVTHEAATGELYDFVMWIDDQPFWNAQIEQINVTAGHELELIPRVGGHTILLGEIDGYQEKLSKLETFYEEGFAKMGWTPYREIDLRYRGQIVGRK
ncbi:MAG: hypothetical protein IJ169_01650 [Paludibacteraceae bacterium]|nr:hypothetical protein [Paludibacteraceae bacterium]